MTPSTLAAALRTGDQNRDRLVPLIASEVVVRFPETSHLPVGRAMVGILWKESNGNPRWYVGDRTAPGGPSIGPLQVYRASAIDLVRDGAIPHPGINLNDRNAYEALAFNEPWGIKAGVAEFATKLRYARGNLEDAIRRYNGAGPHAELYRDRVVGWMQSIPWPSAPAAAGAGGAAILLGLAVGWWYTHRRR